MTLTVTPNSWCRGDYKELLPGRYLNGRTSEILCHDRQIENNNQKLILGMWFIINYKYRIPKATVKRRLQENNKNITKYPPFLRLQNT